ncbi:hypothetical protein Vadar_020504 [Vaccinium darrowii]|uniref:Uncharacterized protein n=1 Tax=Vaccinium darrowii TaxID=229202 RepID=A0ACB7XRU6_9ERIC|nr:hypothetical protein Vadar_020504 [Vaccinium darrowii]
MAFILNLENPFQSLEPEAERLFARETEYMAAPGFFQTGNSNLRRAAQRAMRRLSETPGFVHDPLVPFLALNYYDRSISRERIPGGWFFGLFVISCTVLAWKMRANGFSVAQLLGARPIRVGGVNMEVELGHVERMEFQILSVLNWETRSITPVCFTDFFMSLIGINDLQERQAFKERVFKNQILYMHRDIRFTQFRPSIIAIVGIIAESEEDRLADFWDPVLGSEFVVLDEMENCLNLLDMIRAEEIAGEAVVPQINEPPVVPQVHVVPPVPQDIEVPQVPPIERPPPSPPTPQNQE